MTINSAFPLSNFSVENLPVQRLQLDVADKAGVEVWLLRLDQIDAQISGNKWFKLKHNLAEAKREGVNRVLSFGGAYSNHIHALAWAGSQLGMETIGIIRGEPEYSANPTLTDAKSWGMKLHFVSRAEYRRRYEQDYLDQLQNEYAPCLVIPEGGSNALAVKGCAEIMSATKIAELAPDQVVMACGTGSTLAGVAVSVPEYQVLGIPVLKKASFLFQDIQELMAVAGLKDPGNWSLDLEGHGGGYGKASPQLLEFIETMAERGLPLDHVYTGKMLHRLCQRIESGCYPPGYKILALHTGGLQGLRGLSAT